MESGFRDNVLHPLTSCSFGNLCGLLSRYGFDIRFLPRVPWIGLISLIQQPSCWYESARFRRKIESQKIEPDPSNARLLVTDSGGYRLVA